MYNIKFILSFVNLLPEGDNCRPKHVGGVSHINKQKKEYFIQDVS